jgi:D-psicose/D-tagatose/L-ribulose 3-epimerase
MRGNLVKIAVSNIAWYREPNKFEDFLIFLKKNKCHGIEIAPSIIWQEPIKINLREIDKFNKLLESYNIDLVGFHSLLFTNPKLEFFKDKDTRKKTINYINELIDKCADLNGKKLVYGSPNSRKTRDKKYDDCVKQIIEDFTIIAEHAKAKDQFFCIEPLDKNTTEFISSFEEGGDIVNAVNHNNCRLHLDTKVLFNEKKINNLIKKYSKIIEHVHVSDQDLSEPGTINYEHEEISLALNKINYSKYLTIEMRIQKDVEKSISRSINFLNNKYKNND